VVAGGGAADGAALGGGESVLVSVGAGDVSVDVDESVGDGLSLGLALGAGGGADVVVPTFGEVDLHDGPTAGRDPVPAGPRAPLAWEEPLAAAPE
jgi:hypothetical protein